MGRISLDSLCGGALSEKINMDLAKIGRNIMDPNTDPEKARKLTITMIFKPDKTRQMIKTTMDTKIVTAPLVAAETVLMIGQDIRTGRVEISEYGNNKPAYQVVSEAYAVSAEEIPPDKVSGYDQETGEIHEGRQTEPINLKISK